jgi:hypothetical protein
MRVRGALALLLLLCVNGGLHGAQAGGDGFVRVQGTRFVLNGNPFFANGFNAYWLMIFAADPAQRSKVTEALTQAAGSGLSVARTWAFSDGGSYALQYAPGQYNENTFQVRRHLTSRQLLICFSNYFYGVRGLMFVSFSFLVFRGWILCYLRPGSMGLR